MTDSAECRGSGQLSRSGLFSAGRIGVSLLFLANGFATGSWAPKIPEFAHRLSLNEGALGVMIMIFGIGSLLMMPMAGAAVARLGSGRVSLLCGLALTPMLLLVTVAPERIGAAVAMFLFGGFIGAMDVAMNANAVTVEKTMRRAIMSSCHAFWSLGGLIGAALGGYLIEALGIRGHAVFATVAVGLLIVAAWPLLNRDDKPAGAGEQREPLRLPMTPLPWLIGMIALFAMIPEGAMLDWSALYLRNELGASVTVSGFAYAAFSLTMAAMRFAGDFVRDRFGPVRTLRASAALGMVGLFVAGLASDTTVALIGFAIAGIGIANMSPIIYSAAGSIPGVPSGIGLSVVTTLGYSGILFAPSIIGFIAAHSGLDTVFMFMPLLALAVLALSHLVRHAERT
ncbi:MFS transporter [Rhizobiaceae bacterium BDR2-2]|uniref:MFS transporter n=1 Tax=Ectorhizobium quercum TaxID=2965071 RepID=A0AAE3N417_9HYPH|nr:MFS transporter [Ectorhizobium quercum]MCX8999269.1 MFS transporter [Ectorhizobium quercum]